MHASHTQEAPTNIWSFSNPIHTEHARLMITDFDGKTLVPHATSISRDYITLTFNHRAAGRVLVTDCMDEA